jgi:hypothetical protein
MDARIQSKMRTFLHKDKDNNKYRIGVGYGILNKTQEPNYIIILIGASRIDDFLGANFSYFVNLLYNKVLRSLSIPPEKVSWYQYYPGYNGFKDTCEEVLMDWDSQKEKYKIFMRKTVKDSDLENILGTLRAI